MKEEADVVRSADVLIVGAGLCGLTAAYTLTKASPGLAVAIVEARQRIGGRILTVADAQGRHAFDLGPTWVWPQQQWVLALADALGVQRFQQYEEGHAIFDRGPDAAPQRFLPQGDEGEVQRLVGGAGMLTGCLQAALPVGTIAFNQPVAMIEETAGGLLIATRTGDGPVYHRAQQAIVTLPPRLAANTIAFRPELPPAVLAAMRGTQTWMGQAMKALLVYDRPFWREQGLSGLGISHGGPVAQFHDASPAGGTAGALFGWLDNHSSARTLSPSERQQAIVRQAVRMFGPAAATVRHYAELNWAREPFTTYPQDRVLAEQEHPQYGHSLLQSPQMNGRLHWAGAETSPVSGGYLDGAVYSGQSVAARVLQSTWLAGL